MAKMGVNVLKEIPDIRNGYFTKNGRGGRKDYGGYSPCCTGKVEVFEGSTLNNCVGGAWGCFAMAENNPDCKVGFIKASTYPQDAGSWYNGGNGSKWDNYERGQEPREGAVICYQNHVAYVSSINGDELRLISSGYGNTTKAGLEWRTVKKSQNYRWPTGTICGEFMGFIYPKDSKPEPQPVPPVEPITTEQAITKMAQDVIAGKYGNGFNRKERLYKVIQSKVNELMQRH